MNDLSCDLALLGYTVLGVVTTMCRNVFRALCAEIDQIKEYPVCYASKLNPLKPERKYSLESLWHENFVPSKVQNKQTKDISEKGNTKNLSTNMDHRPICCPCNVKHPSM